MNQKISSSEEKYQAISNLELTDIKFEEQQQIEISIPRDQERLSLTIRYVPAQINDSSYELN